MKKKMKRNRAYLAMNHNFIWYRVHIFELLPATNETLNR